MTPLSWTGIFTSAALLVSSLPAFAQKTGTSTSTGSTSGSTSTGTVGTRPGTTTGTTGVPGTTGATTTNPTPTVTTPIFLTGRVRIDDGSPLPGPANIERICNGATHTEGYTAMDGTFGIQLGNESGVFQDATDSPSMSSMTGTPNSGTTSGMSGGASPSSQERLLNNCDLRAKLPGFRSQSIMLAGRRALDNPDLGIILLHREAPGEGSTVSATSLNAPKAARKAFDKGQDLVKKNKLADAREEFEKAVQIDQNYAAAWCELGRLQAASGDRDMARGSFRVALKSDPKFVNPYIELTALALQDRKYQEAADLSDQALKLNSFDYPQAFLFNAAARYNMAEVEIAEKRVLEAQALDSRHQFPEIQHLYGAILQHKKDYPGAVEQYRAYLREAPNADDVPLVQKQLDILDKLTTAAK